LNKRVLSSITIAIALLALLPISALPRAHAVTQASLVVNPSFTVGNPGDVFTVEVDVDNVASLVAYDVQLHYNGAAVNVQSVDFSGPFAGSGCNTLVLIHSFSDPVGLIRSAVTTFSGCSVNVDDFTTGPVPVFVATFAVVSTANSVFHVTADSECACSALAQIDMSGNIVAVPHSSSDGNFFAEPNIVFHTTYFVTSTPRQPKLSQGFTSVVLSSNIRLANGETLSGFAFVVFDVITPTGNDVTVQSNEVFLNPGDSATVSATFSFGTQVGTYSMFGTLWRGSAPNAIVPFTTATGQTFQVHAH
jgi:hypothetical protein